MKRLILFFFVMLGLLSAVNATYNVTTDLSATDTGDWIGTNNTLSSVYNPNNNLIYYGFDGGKFGVYNPITNITYDLSATDSANWFGTDSITALTYNPNNNLIYIGGTNGKFGYYNSSSNISTSLMATDTGNWMGTTGVNSMAFNSNDNRVYLGLDSGKFGVYNSSSNVATDLSATDTGNWIGTSFIYAVVYNSNDNRVYLGGTAEKFGYYNSSSNVTTSLTITLFGGETIRSMLYNNNLIYYGLTNGKFAVYNSTSNLTSDLSNTDGGGWMTNAIYFLTYNNNDSRIYLGGNTDRFGVYSPITNITYDLSATDTGDWIGTSWVYTGSYYNSSIYLGIGNGKLGVYDSLYIPSLNFTTIGITNNSYYNNSYLNITNNITTSNTNVNQTYYLYYNNGSLINSTQYATNNINGIAQLTNLADNTYKIFFFANNGELTSITSNYTFTIDTLNPNLSVNFPSFFNNRTINFSNYITYNDTNIFTCIVTINSSNSTNCNSSFTFNNDGTFTGINISVTDLVGRITSSLNNVIIIDSIKPEITSLVMNDTFLINGETALLTIIFNEAIYNFSNTDITTIDNGVLSAVTSSNNITWTSIFTPNTGVTDATNVIIINKTNINDYYGNTGEGINSTANYEIYTTSPSLNVSLPNEYNYYTGFNFSQYINYSDSLGVSSCIVTILDFNSTTCNNTNYNFSLIGNKTINITLTDLVGNINSSLNNIMLINPYQTFTFYDYLRLTNINDFYIDGVSYSNNYTFKTYDYGLGSWNFNFSKEGYINQTYSFTLNDTSNYNQTINVTAVTITIKAYDIDTLVQIPFNLTLSGGVIAQYYNQVNFSDYYNNTSQGDVNALISSIGYSDASYNINIGAYSALTLTAYLIPLNDSDLFQFTVLSQDTGAALANVLIEVQELINTSYITASSKLTGDNGKTYFYLDSSKEYKIIFSKDEYVTATAFTIPTVTTYTVKLTGDSTTFNYVNGVSYSFKPSEYLLQNNETYNFIGFISGDSLTSSNFSIVLNNGTTIYTNSNVNPTGTTYNYSYTIPAVANFTQMTMTINYIIDGELFTVSKEYKVITLNEDSFIKTMQNFAESNTEESNLWKWFIVMVSTVLVLISGAFLGTSVPLLIIPLWVFFSFVGWVDFTFTAVISVVALIMFLGGRR